MRKNLNCLSSKWALTLGVLTLFFVLSSGLSAHTVYLKNGQRITGKITSQNKESLEISVNGKVITILKSTIEQIDYFDREIKSPVVKRPVKVKTETVEKSEGWGLNKWTITGRSTLIPGWGHYAAEEYYWAGGHAALNLSALAYVITSRSKALDAKAVYEQKVLVNMAASQVISNGDLGTSVLSNFVLGASNFNTYQSSVSQYNNAIAMLAIVYIAQLGHAYYTGTQYDKAHGNDKVKEGSKKKGSFMFYLGPDPTLQKGNNQYASLNYTLRF
jgi:hypothetical protein